MAGDDTDQQPGTRSRRALRARQAAGRERTKKHRAGLRSTYRTHVTEASAHHLELKVENALLGCDRLLTDPTTGGAGDAPYADPLHRPCRTYLPDHRRFGGRLDSILSRVAVEGPDMRISSIAQTY